MKFIVFALLSAVVVAGCQWATVKETYQQTPARATSVGEGVTEYWVWTREGWVRVELVPAPLDKKEIKP
jgi:hypothetical protein